MPNIYDYMRNPERAVMDGYRACYLTRVSTLLCNATNGGFKRALRYTRFGLDETLRDNIQSIPYLIIPLVVIATLPINCWFIALFLPKGGE